MEYDFNHMLEDPFTRLPRASVHQIELCKDNNLFRQGEPTRGLFRLLTGRIRMCRITEDGQPITIFSATTGDLFAEASIFSEAYHCDAICVEDAIVERFAKSAVKNALEYDPGFAFGFSRLLAIQVQKSRQLLELLSIKSAEERIFAALQLGLLDGTVIEFASKIGLTHEVCYRALKKLVVNGRIFKTSRGSYAPK